MKIAKNCFVIIEYDLHLEDGSCIKGQNGLVSMNFITGYNQVLPGLEQRLIGLEQGEKADFAIPAAEAFGVYDQGLVQTRTLSEFPEGRQLEPGKWAVAKNEATHAQYSYLVREKTDSSVTLDFNHPLAEKDLFYRVTVILVRAALPDELEFLRPCENSKEEEA